MGTQQHSMVVGSPNTHSKVFAKVMELARLFGLHLVCAWFTQSTSLALPPRSPVLSCLQALLWSAAFMSMTATFLSWLLPPISVPRVFKHPSTQPRHLARQCRSYWWSALTRQKLLEWRILLLQGWSVEASFITILPGYLNHLQWAAGPPSQAL